jgi:hypothetical protein
MKMFKAFILSLTVAVGVNAMAGTIFGAMTYSVDIVSSPLNASIFMVRCFQGTGPNDECAAAGTSATLTAPFSTSTLLLLKEEVKEVEGDAYGYLAGEMMTDALKELVEKVRAQDEVLEKASDKEVVSVLVELLSI